MTKKLPAEAIRDWAAKHLDRRDDSIGTWEKTWFSEEEHLLTMLRLMENDSGAWIIILSCSASYGASEDQWKGTNIGCAKSIAQIQSIYDGLNTA